MRPAAPYPAAGRLPPRAMMHFGHSFRDESLLELALTHASTGEPQNNERLEFLGDAVLDLIVAEEFFQHGSELPEGDMTELKAWVVSRRVLAEAARDLGLGEQAKIGAGMRQRTLPRSVLANLYEAVLGAVYLDAGLEAARAFARETLKRQLEQAGSLEGVENPKQELQRHAQLTTGEPPSYRVLEERGNAHAKAFKVSAFVGEREFPTAWGRTRKEAERWAAHEANLVLERESAE